MESAVSVVEAAFFLGNSGKVDHKLIYIDDDLVAFLDGRFDDRSLVSGLVDTASYNVELCLCFV